MIYAYSDTTTTVNTSEITVDRLHVRPVGAESIYEIQAINARVIEFQMEIS